MSSSALDTLCAFPEHDIYVFLRSLKSEYSFEFQTATSGGVNLYQGGESWMKGFMNRP